jgi:hypothetical protein
VTEISSADSSNEEVLRRIDLFTGEERHLDRGEDEMPPKM